VTSVGPFVFIYGGLKGSQLLDDLLLAGEHSLVGKRSGLAASMIGPVYLC
jgi:hypothetical protein